MIHGTGPRYCPSIEDKVVKFADKNRHQVFLGAGRAVYERDVYRRNVQFSSRGCSA